MRTTAALLAIAGASALTQANMAVASYTFEMFESEFNRSYETIAERAMRRDIFYKNIETIKSLNENDQSATFGITRFADMTPEEMTAFLGKKSERAEGKTYRFTSPSLSAADLPKHVDWRDKGVITPVKSQGQCGSCWAFAAIAAFESSYALATGELQNFSEQQLVDCTPNPEECGGKGGCNGSTATLAFDYIKSTGGVTTEKEYPYKGKDQKCKDSKVKKTATVVDHGFLPINEYLPTLQYIATQGPLAIALDANPFFFYRSGVLTSCVKGEKANVAMNHAVQLVGYGTDEATGLDYWLVRNSWGDSWGEKGYIRVYRDKPDEADFCNWDRSPLDGSGCAKRPDADKPFRVCGSCGILNEPTFVSAAPIKGLELESEDEAVMRF